MRLHMQSLVIGDRAARGFPMYEILDHLKIRRLIVLTRHDIVQLDIRPHKNDVEFDDHWLDIREFIRYQVPIHHISCVQILTTSSPHTVTFCDRSPLVTCEAQAYRLPDLRSICLLRRFCSSQCRRRYHLRCNVDTTHLLFCFQLEGVHLLTLDSNTSQTALA